MLLVFLRAWNLNQNHFILFSSRSERTTTLIN
jgi:hypothetical protein